ncbi:hypothetical protein STRDD11_02473 [Streptococcus sp. DD11]|nr:hypothetical protein STRDD11_02473 [Streptococcus sp. DD11]
MNGTKFLKILYGILSKILPFVGEGGAIMGDCPTAFSFQTGQ